MQKDIVRTWLAMKNKQQQASWKVKETHQGFQKAQSSEKELFKT